MLTLRVRCCECERLGPLRLPYVSLRVRCPPKYPHPGLTAPLRSGYASRSPKVGEGEKETPRTWGVGHLGVDPATARPAQGAGQAGQAGLRMWGSARVRGGVESQAGSGCGVFSVFVRSGQIDIKSQRPG
jgi:hypothetical protein